MTRTILALALTLAALIAALPTQAGTIVDGEKFSLDADGRLQWLAVGQKVSDDFRNDGRLYLFMKQARMRFSGRYESTTFDIQWAYGGEDVVAASPGVALSLLDFSFDVPLSDATHVKVGQFRVPFGRERLTSSGTLNFGDRSIQNIGFAWNRDVGAALHTYRGKIAATAGVFTGGGRDVPQRYLPEIIGSPLFVGRVGYNDGIDEDIYNVSARDRAPDRLKKAFFVNGLFLKDTLIGHSTVLNVRSTDKFLLINGNWNPFIAKQPLVRGQVVQMGADTVYRKPIRGGALSFEAEANYAKFKNSYGSIALKGARVQMGVAKDKVEMNLRYAALFPDTKMANTFTPSGATTPSNSPLVADKKPLQELTPSLTYHYKPNVTVVMDLPILIDALVFTENKVGAYIATEQPDQASVVKPNVGRVDRKSAIEGRLMLQFTF